MEKRLLLIALLELANGKQEKENALHAQKVLINMKLVRNRATIVTKATTARTLLVGESSVQKVLLTN